MSGTPPPCRDYVTVCNLANKVRVFCDIIISVYLNIETLFTGFYNQ